MLPRISAKGKLLLYDHLRTSLLFVNHITCIEMKLLNAASK